MQLNDDYEKRIQDLERKVQALESIINGTSRNRPGRKPLFSADTKAEIILKHNAGSPYSRLAAEYGVAKTTICNICHSGKETSQFVIPVQKG